MIRGVAPTAAAGPGGVSALLLIRAASPGTARFKREEREADKREKRKERGGKRGEKREEKKRA